LHAKPILIEREAIGQGQRILRGIWEVTGQGQRLLRGYREVIGHGHIDAGLLPPALTVRPQRLIAK